MRLGLDVGTNSIGWALIDTETGRIIDLGSRIFSDGRDPKSGASLAVDRRDARAARRRRDRYLGRRSAFLDTLIRYGLMSDKADEAKLVEAKDPYVLRTRALNERLEPHEIGRALFHLNQRRGFRSNRKAAGRLRDKQMAGVPCSGRRSDERADRDVEDVVEVRLDATQNYTQPQ